MRHNLSSRPALARLTPGHLAAAAALLAGCNAPVRTPGTEGLPPERLALVRVRQHDGLAAWRGRPVHIETVYADDAEYPLARDRDVLLTPGPHKLAVDYGLCPHGRDRTAGDFDADAGVFTGPFGRIDATLEAGATYTVTADPTLVGRNATETRHGLRPVARDADERTK